MQHKKRPSYSSVIVCRILDVKIGFHVEKNWKCGHFQAIKNQESNFSVCLYPTHTWPIPANYQQLHMADPALRILPSY